MSFNPFRCPLTYYLFPILCNPSLIIPKWSASVLLIFLKCLDMYLFQFHIIFRFYIIQKNLNGSKTTPSLNHGHHIISKTEKNIFIYSVFNISTNVVVTHLLILTNIFLFSLCGITNYSLHFASFRILYFFYLNTLKALHSPFTSSAAPKGVFT